MNICKLLEKWGLVCCHVWVRKKGIGKYVDKKCNTKQKLTVYSRVYYCKKCGKVRSRPVTNIII